MGSILTTEFMESMEYSCTDRQFSGWRHPYQPVVQEVQSIEYILTGQLYRHFSPRSKSFPTSCTDSSAQGVHPASCTDSSAYRVHPYRLVVQQPMKYILSGQLYRQFIPRNAVLPARSTDNSVRCVHPASCTDSSAYRVHPYRLVVQTLQSMCTSLPASCTGSSDSSVHGIHPY
jgi:hypothetical protein